MSKPKKNIQEMVQKEMPEFADACQSLSTPELEARLSQLAKDNDDVENAKESDEKLEAAQAQAFELGAPYRESKKAIKLKTKYIISLLKG